MNRWKKPLLIIGGLLLAVAIVFVGSAMLFGFLFFRSTSVTFTPPHITTAHRRELEKLTHLKLGSRRQIEYIHADGWLDPCTFAKLSLTPAELQAFMAQPALRKAKWTRLPELPNIEEITHWGSSQLRDEYRDVPPDWTPSRVQKGRMTAFVVKQSADDTDSVELLIDESSPSGYQLYLFWSCN